MTTQLLDPAPAALCDVCGAWPLNQCHGLDNLPLDAPHAERTETTPIHDALRTAAASSTNSLPSRRRADAGTPTTVTRPPGRATASTRSGQSTRASTPTAGQGTLAAAAGGAR